MNIQDISQNFLNFFSMKSLTAAGKFKKRRYKEENQKKAVRNKIK